LFESKILTEEESISPERAAINNLTNPQATRSESTGYSCHYPRMDGIALQAGYNSIPHLTFGKTNISFRSHL
jgi:hypothetical protein